MKDLPGFLIIGFGLVLLGFAWGVDITGTVNIEATWSGIADTITAVATIGLVFLGFYVRNDFKKQENHRLALEQANIISDLDLRDLSWDVYIGLDTIMFDLHMALEPTFAADFSAERKKLIGSFKKTGKKLKKLRQARVAAESISRLTGRTDLFTMVSVISTRFDLVHHNLDFMLETWGGDDSDDAAERILNLLDDDASMASITTSCALPEREVMMDEIESVRADTEQSLAQIYAS